MATPFIWTRITYLMADRIHGISTKPDRELRGDRRIISVHYMGPNWGFIHINNWSYDWMWITHYNRQIFNTCYKKWSVLHKPQKIIFKNADYFNSADGNLMPYWHTPNGTTSIILSEAFFGYSGAYVKNGTVILTDFKPQVLKLVCMTQYDDAPNKLQDYSFIDISNEIITCKNYHSPPSFIVREKNIDFEKKTLTIDDQIFMLPQALSKQNYKDLTGKGIIKVYNCNGTYVINADIEYWYIYEGVFYLTKSETLTPIAAL